MIYKMKLHQDIKLDDEYNILRVAGGWIYYGSFGQTFVPFNNEFQKAKEQPNDE